MKICHMTCVHSRYDVRILEKECSTLAANGYDTYLIVNDDLPDEIINGVNIVSTGFKPAGRAQRLIKTPSVILRKALTVDADVYHLHDPELLLIAGRLFGKGKKVIFDSHEDTEQQIRDKTWIPALLRIPASIGYRLYFRNRSKKLAGLIAVTPDHVEKYRKFFSKTVMVTNYPLIGKDEDQSCNRAIDDKYVFFAGNLTSQWCHEKIADAVLPIESVKYVIAGRMDDREYIDRVIERGCVDYIGQVPHGRVKGYYKHALAGMAILKCTQVGNKGTLGNTKLFEVMQAGVPVICSDLELWRQIIEEYSCGICVNSDSISDITKAIEALLNDPEKARAMGENGKRAVAEKYNWDTQAKVLLGLYQDI